MTSHSTTPVFMPFRFRSDSIKKRLDNVDFEQSIYRVPKLVCLEDSMNSDLINFDDYEKEVLSLYCRVCDSIKERRFVKNLSNQDHSLRIWKNQDGEWENYFPVYDEEDYRSFMIEFRKLNQASRYFSRYPKWGPLRFRERKISDYYAYGCPRPSCVRLRGRYFAGARIAPGSTMTLRRVVRLIFCPCLRWSRRHGQNIRRLRLRGGRRTSCAPSSTKIRPI